jgi:hypothetical protein
VISLIPHGVNQLVLTLANSDAPAVPVNLKTEDKFHLTIEEYLHAVLSLVEELVIHTSFRYLAL